MLFLVIPALFAAWLAFGSGVRDSEKNGWNTGLLESMAIPNWWGFALKTWTKGLAVQGFFMSAFLSKCCFGFWKGEWGRSGDVWLWYI